MNEYDLFLEKNNLSRDTSRKITEQVKKEVGFNENYESREPFEDLISYYVTGGTQ
ncbi:hypothetical protein [Psychrobacillus sp. BM2]|uniref:hypothetical protein n=1 Tax=Psychrobacillus sp. BM2 TaxID=3400421 RepID=UPI003B0283A7